MGDTDICWLKCDRKGFRFKPYKLEVYACPMHTSPESYPSWLDLTTRLLEIENAQRSKVHPT